MIGENSTDGVKKPGKARYMCQMCGYISDVLPEKCPVCGANKVDFRKIE